MLCSLVRMHALCTCRLLVGCICSRYFDPYLLCILNFHIYDLIREVFRNKISPSFPKSLRFISILLRSALCKIPHLFYVFFFLLLFLHICISFIPQTLKSILLSVFIVSFQSFEQNFTESVCRCCYSFFYWQECKSFRFKSPSCTD